MPPFVVLNSGSSNHDGSVIQCCMMPSVLCSLWATLVACIMHSKSSKSESPSLPSQCSSNQRIIVEIQVAMMQQMLVGCSNFVCKQKPQARELGCTAVRILKDCGEGARSNILFCTFIFASASTDFKPSVALGRNWPRKVFVLYQTWLHLGSNRCIFHSYNLSCCH